MSVVKSDLIKELADNYPNFLRKDLTKLIDITISEMQNALIGTGFPFRNSESLTAYVKSFQAVLQQTQGVRRAGAAALDLAYVAAARLDGFWETHLKPWDIAAGALLIQEAGGRISDFKGGEQYLDGDIIAATPAIFKHLLQTIHPYFTS